MTGKYFKHTIKNWNTSAQEEGGGHGYQDINFPLTINLLDVTYDLPTSKHFPPLVFDKKSINSHCKNIAMLVHPCHMHTFHYHKNKYPISTNITVPPKFTFLVISHLVHKVSWMQPLLSRHYVTSHNLVYEKTTFMNVLLLEHLKYINFTHCTNCDRIYTLVSCHKKLCVTLITRGWLALLISKKFLQARILYIITNHYIKNKYVKYK